MVMSNPFYKSKEWRALRARCVSKNKKINGGVLICAQCGNVIREMANVDHIQRVRDAPHLALEITNLQVLHQSCHSKLKQIQEYNADKPEIGLDGMPQGTGWQW
jgi:5-methylcytosine-specific restriction endonuclease McrA